MVSSAPVGSLEQTGGTPAFGRSILAWVIPERSGLTYRESWVLGQNMQTPADIERRELIENDVPYVGFLGWGNSFYGFDNEYFFGAQWLFGWVGEEALAEQAQKFVHAIIGGDDPQGWDNQLDSGPDRSWNGLTETPSISSAQSARPFWDYTGWGRGLVLI